MRAGKGKGARIAGIVAFPVGGAAVVGGLSMMFWGAFAHGLEVPRREGPGGGVVAGGVMAGVGALLIVGGIVAVTATRPTRYEFARLRPAPGGLAITF